MSQSARLVVCIASCPRILLDRALKVRRAHGAYPEQDTLVQAEENHGQNREDLAKRVQDDAGGKGRRCHVEGQDAVDGPC
jgi:hypothetical protein